MGKTAKKPGLPKNARGLAANYLGSGDSIFWRYLLPGTLLGLAICFGIRWYWPYFHTKLGTYPSDVWYIYTNYGWFLKNQGFFVNEYPAAMYMVFKGLAVICQLFPNTEPGKYGGTIYTYHTWLIINSLFLGGCTVAVVWCLHRCNEEFFHHKPTRLLWALVFSPTLICFSIYNYDICPVLCCVVGFWLFLRKDYSLSFLILGIGGALKIFPFVAAVALLLAVPKKERLVNMGWMIAPWLCINIPFMLVNLDTWLYPYTWQMEFDNAPQQGHFIYHLTQLGGKHLALSLAAGGSLALLYAIWRKLPEDLDNRPKWLAQAGLLLVVLFILTKNVFSPQYLLWILPFCVLGTGYPWYGLATVVELLNAAEAINLEYWRSGHEWGLYLIRTVRDCGLIALLISCSYNLIKPSLKK